MRAPLGRRVAARPTLIVIGVAALVVPFFAGSAFADPSNSRSIVAGSKPAWAATASVVGTPSAATKISFNVVLPLRDAAGAARLAAAVSDPTNAKYGHYVSAAQFNASYAPTDAQVAKIKDFLAGAGLAVTGVAPGNRWVAATGTARQVESAFATKLRNYRYKGRTIREPSTSLSVPRRIAGLVSGIVGVGTESLLRRPAIATSGSTGPTKPFTAPGNATATPDSTPPAPVNCAKFWNQVEQTGPTAYGSKKFATDNCGYSPAQLRGAYGVQASVSAGNTGRGVTVAIIDAYASPTMLADANGYSTFQGEPKFATGQYNETTFTPFNDQTECGGETGWNQEESLDVEAVHGLAPGATVQYIGAQNCDTGLDDATNYVIQNQIATIVSNSYGDLGEDIPSDEVASEHAMFVQAAAEGIGFYFSSGDDGDNVAINGTPHPEPDYPASDPMVTAVGGTSLAINSSKGYQFETSWGDDVDTVNFATTPATYSHALPGPFAFGGGGGVSALFAEPAYQKSAVPTSLAKLNGGAAMRVVPDIAAIADPELGYLIETGGVRGDIGGTSLACPVIAGLQALASQGRIVPIGFANPVLYSLGLASGAFHDVKAPASPTAIMTETGSALLTLGKDSSLTATSGYDDSTGPGSPNGLTFLLGERLLSSRPLPGVPHAP